MIDPYVLEERSLNAVPISIYSRLLFDRIIFLGEEITNEIGNIVQAQLLYLDSLNHNPIRIYINSPGGSVYDGLCIYDTIKLIKSPVHTICTGMAASMASVLLSVGKERSALKHSRIMIHQPSGGIYGQESDIAIVAKEIKRTKDELYTILAENTGKSFEEIEKDSDRDYWMTAEEALEYGIIDKIL